MDEGFVFLLSNKFVGDQFFKCCGAKMAFSDPAYGLQVAQSPRVLLDIRFQVIRGIAKSKMAFLLLGELGLEKGVNGPPSDWSRW